ncbi:MAG: signal recognition particle-docking protein FtsY, partial [Pseudomonas sp.]|nr:signal recognition particle-docking protein FtsY [Pseudomonas sp.]
MFGSNDDKKNPAPAGEKKGLFGWLRKKQPVVEQPQPPAQDVPEQVAPTVAEPAINVAPVSAPTPATPVAEVAPAAAPATP